MSLTPEVVEDKIAQLKSLASDMMQTVDSPTAETNATHSRTLSTARLKPTVPMPEDVSTFFPEPDVRRGKVSIRRKELLTWMENVKRSLGCTLLSRRLLNFLCEHNTNNNQMSEACRLPAMDSTALYDRELNDDRIAKDVQTVFREHCPASVQARAADEDVNAGRTTLRLRDLLAEVIAFDAAGMGKTQLIVAWHDVYLRVQVVLKLMRALVSLRQAQGASS